MRKDERKKGMKNERKKLVYTEYTVIHTVVYTVLFSKLLAFSFSFFISVFLSTFLLLSVWTTFFYFLCFVKFFKNRTFKMCTVHVSHLPSPKALPSHWEGYSTFFIRQMAVSLTFYYEKWTLLILLFLNSVFQIFLRF